MIPGAIQAGLPRRARRECRAFIVARTEALIDHVFPKLDECRAGRALARTEKERYRARTRYAAKSWSHTRRALARVEVTWKGVDVRTLSPTSRAAEPRILIKRRVLSDSQSDLPDLLRYSAREVGHGPSGWRRGAILLPVS